MAKAEMKRRKDEKEQTVGNSRYTSKYPFSGLLICGECGHKLRRHVRRVGSGKVIPAFGCSNRIVNGREVCDSHHVNEDTLQRTYIAAIKRIVDDADNIIQTILKVQNWHWSRRTLRRWQQWRGKSWRYRNP